MGLEAASLLLDVQPGVALLPRICAFWAPARGIDVPKPPLQAEHREQLRPIPSPPGKQGAVRRSGRHSVT
eukprot:15444631-Alexandrium_andersonii.AAC.1